VSLKYSRQNLILSLGKVRKFTHDPSRSMNPVCRGLYALNCTASTSQDESKVKTKSRQVCHFNLSRDEDGTRVGLRMNTKSEGERTKVKGV